MMGESVINIIAQGWLEVTLLLSPIQHDGRESVINPDLCPQGMVLCGGRGEISSLTSLECLEREKKSYDSG